MRLFYFLRVNFCKVLIFLLVFFPAACGDNASPGAQFSSSYEDFALQENELPEVVQDHPRLYLRSEPWAHGPSLAQLREWSKVDPFKGYLEGKAWDRRPWREWAFRYLVTGDESLVQPIVDKMKKQKGYWPGYLTTLATIYDWLYNSPNFNTEDKKLIEKKMVSWGKAAIRKGEQYQDMWSHYGYGPLTDLAAAGLALHGHRKEAEEFLALAGGYLKKNFLPGWELNEGAWQGGWAYYSQGPGKLITLIHLWSAGTDDDLYEIIAREQGDWLRKHLHFLLRGSYDDEGPLQTGGFSYSPYINGMKKGALPITYAYQDENGIAEFDFLKKAPWGAKIWQFLFYSPEMHQKEVQELTMPLSQLWGREGIGYAQMRSGWGEGETLIDFKCGDYFWSHQFHNQNSFTIHRSGQLAVQSGIYDAYWGPHMQFYHRPTVSSNSMLVIQPGEKSWVPSGTADKNGVPNNNGYIPEFGGQRTCFMHPELGSGENCFSFEKYLYRKNHQHHFETGTMQAWEVGEGYTYASGDATMAYNNPEFSYPGNSPKLDHASRDLVFLDKKYLLVFDRVNALDAAYEKRWLLHTVGEPQVETEKVSSQVPEHIETYKAGKIRVDNKEGTLFVQPVFPEDYRIRIVGGTPNLSEIKAESSNKGDARLESEVNGKYAAMGGTIATDAAGPETWTIEFVSNKEFVVTGSKTGQDGKGKIGNNFLSKSYSLMIPKENWKGTPQQGDSFKFKTTGSSYRFWVNGKNHAPNIKKMYGVLKDGSKVHPGNWRIEVSPKAPDKFDTFLHFLYPCDREGAQAPDVQGIRSGKEELKGLVVDDWLVMFRVRGSLKDRVSYSVNRESVKKHLILGLEPGKEFLITTNSENRYVKQASSEGVLSFEHTGPGEISILPQ